MPGEGAPTVHGFSGWMGSGSTNEPTISVPPEMLITGQRFWPIDWKYHMYDVSSQGSPVEPRRRRVFIGNLSGVLPRISMRTAVGETPNVVMRCNPIISHRRFAFG